VFKKIQNLKTRVSRKQYILTLSTSIFKKMSRKKIASIILLLLVNITFSQVGIGTANPNPSAVLDIVSSNSGLLIPRIALSSTTDVSTIPSPATSLLVYNTATVSNVTPGFYFFEGTWKPMAGLAGSTAGWSLTGNTISDANFLGSTNFNSLFFRVNNQQFAKFAPNGGISIGKSSIANDNNSIAIGTNSNASASNEAIALGRNTTASGFQSTAIGVSTTASANSTVAIGVSSNVSGFQSIGIGVSSVSNTDNSLAIGNNSNASGQQATALGSQANSSGQNATAIGFQATATQSNSIILGSSANVNNRVGIGTNAPTERLHIDGSIRIVDGTQNNNFVLTSDATGKASWRDLNANKAYAELFRTTDLQLPAGTIQLNSTGENFNVSSVGSNGIQVKISGVYRVSFNMTIQKVTNGAVNIQAFLAINNSEIPGTRMIQTCEPNDYENISISRLVNLTAFQTVSAQSVAANNLVTIVANSANLIVELVR
jgi:hypothetical protein